ncbi:MAG: CDP-alcohol phosphatidyltransferase family protein [Myxococcales bacterium]|jgi:phosphatidylglycerophosphate synthase
MRSELSIEMREEKAAEVAAERDALAPPTATRFEKRIIETLCEPLLPRIPASVHPNTISLVTHAIAWTTAALAVGSVFAETPLRSLMLVGAGVGTLLSMIGDCIDGMHARRTDQCSKLGEMMDHWLDAIIVPLTIGGITVALEMPTWALILVCTTAIMIYQAQLVLYHHTGKFIHPEPASGVEGQFSIAIAYVALAVLFFFSPRHVAWLDLAIGLLAAAGIFVQMRCNWFYYVRLGAHITRHLNFVAMLGSLSLLHTLGAVDLFGFLFGLVFISFRISGTYVLRTIVGRSFDGNDWGIYAFLGVMAVAHMGVLSTGASLPGVGETDLATALPYLMGLYVLGRNFADFARHYPALRPTSG